MRHILKGSAQQQLASGVTTVRGAGDPLFADLAVRDAIDAGKYQGPRLVAPGTGVTVPGGHGAGLFAQVANSPVEAAEQVRDLYARGADVIKLFVTGGVFDATEVGEPGVLRMPLDFAAAACKAAHEVGLPVMAHVESTEGEKAALQAGVDTIEHGAPLTPEILELYRAPRVHSLRTVRPALPAPSARRCRLYCSTRKRPIRPIRKRRTATSCAQASSRALAPHWKLVLGLVLAQIRAARS